MNSDPGSDRYLQLIEALQGDGRNDAEIAIEAGVSQPTVWRLRHLERPRTRLSKPFNKLYAFYGLTELKSHSTEVSLEAELKDAILGIWDGSSMHARALIKVIKSLNGLGGRSRGDPAKLAADGGRYARNTD